MRAPLVLLFALGVTTEVAMMSDASDSAAVRRTSRWWFMGGGPWGTDLPWLNKSFADQAVELVTTHRAAMTGVCLNYSTSSLFSRHSACTHSILRLCSAVQVHVPAT